MAGVGTRIEWHVTGTTGELRELSASDGEEQSPSRDGHGDIMASVKVTIALEEECGGRGCTLTVSTRDLAQAKKVYHEIQVKVWDIQRRLRALSVESERHRRRTKG